MAMTLCLTDDEQNALRETVKREHRSMQDVAFDLVMSIAEGNLADVQKIAEMLAPWVRPEP